MAYSKKITFFLNHPPTPFPPTISHNSSGDQQDTASSIQQQRFDLGPSVLRLGEPPTRAARPAMEKTTKQVTS